jgi:hypothetical protein
MLSALGLIIRPDAAFSQTSQWGVQNIKYLELRDHYHPHLQVTRGWLVLLLQGERLSPKRNVRCPTNIEAFRFMNRGRWSESAMARKRAKSMRQLKTILLLRKGCDLHVAYESLIDGASRASRTYFFLLARFVLGT